MLETRPQITDALDEIQSITEWPDAEIARRAGLHRATISRIRSGVMKWPGAETREKLGILLLKARELRK